MQEVKIAIDADALQGQITQAILDSAIGRQLKATLEELAKKWNVNGYWQNNLTKVVEAEVQQEVRNQVVAALRPLLATAVQKFITPDVVEKAAQYAFGSIEFKNTRY